MEGSTADTKERSPVQSPCRVVTSVTHDSQSLFKCHQIISLLDTKPPIFHNFLNYKVKFFVVAMNQYFKRMSFSVRLSVCHSSSGIRSEKNIKIVCRQPSPHHAVCLIVTTGKPVSGVTFGDEIQCE